MVNLSIPFCAVTLWCVWGVNSATPSAPAPTQDCSTVILSMSDCLSFVTSGSVIKKPEGGCCFGLKTVLKTSPVCLCEAFKNSGQLGIPLNMTKAITLPEACNVKAPSFSNCGISLAGAPGASPPAQSSKSPRTMPPSSPSATTMSPSEGPGASDGGSSSEGPPSSPSATTMSPSEGPGALDGGSSGLTTPALAPGGTPNSSASAISLSLGGLVGMVALSYSIFRV